MGHSNTGKVFFFRSHHFSGANNLLLVLGSLAGAGVLAAEVQKLGALQRDC